MKYPIGTRFIKRQDRKSGLVNIVVDYHTTTNMAGEVVKKRYVVGHYFCGQTVVEYNVVQTTIDMSTLLANTISIQALRGDVS